MYISIYITTPGAFRRLRLPLSFSLSYSPVHLECLLTFKCVYSFLDGRRRNAFIMHEDAHRLARIAHNSCSFPERVARPLFPLMHTF